MSEDQRDNCEIVDVRRRKGQGEVLTYVIPHLVEEINNFFIQLSLYTHHTETCGGREKMMK